MLVRPGMRNTLGLIAAGTSTVSVVYDAAAGSANFLNLERLTVVTSP
jgi:hypothetical protein